MAEITGAHQRLVTANEIAELLCVTPKWVYSACRKYGMPYYQIGRYRRFSELEVFEWAWKNAGSELWADEEAL